MLLSLTRFEGGEGVVAAFESREAQGELYRARDAHRSGVLRGATAQAAFARVRPYGDASERALDFDAALEAPVELSSGHPQPPKLPHACSRMASIDGRRCSALCVTALTVPMAAGGLPSCCELVPAAKSLTQTLARTARADFVASVSCPNSSPREEKTTLMLVLAHRAVAPWLPSTALRSRVQHALSTSRVMRRRLRAMPRSFKRRAMR